MQGDRGASVSVPSVLGVKHISAQISVDSNSCARRTAGQRRYAFLTG